MLYVVFHGVCCSMVLTISSIISVKNLLFSSGPRALVWNPRVISSPSGSSIRLRTFILIISIFIAKALILEYVMIFIIPSSALIPLIIINPPLQLV